jgi:hypothetical protein
MFVNWKIDIDFLKSLYRKFLNQNFLNRDTGVFQSQAAKEGIPDTDKAL